MGKGNEVIRTVDGRWGKCSYFGKDEFVGRSIHNYGEYNPDETEQILILADSTRVGTICLDVGANIGCISQALLVNGFDVVAYEPQAEVCELLRQNMYHASQGEGHGKGECHNVAVGADMGIVEIPKLHYSDKNNVGGVSVNTRSMYGSYKVPLVSLDDMHDTDDVGFIKIDVEGYELEVLKGATKLINRCKPILYIEDDRREKSAALRAYIKGLGYSIEDHMPELYREQNFFGLKKNIWERRYASHNIICKPC